MSSVNRVYPPPKSFPGDKKAKFSMILGLSSLLFLIFTAVPAIILGAMAIDKKVSPTGKVHAMIGMTFSGIVIFACVIALAIFTSENKTKKTSKVSAPASTIMVKESGYVRTCESRQDCLGEDRCNIIHDDNAPGGWRGVCSDPPKAGPVGGSKESYTQTTSGYTIKYQVSGTANRASLTYRNAQGGTEQKKVSIPWETSFSASKGSFLYLSAQNQGRKGKITTSILVNGNVVKESTSEGAYVIASCDGVL